MNHAIVTRNNETYIKFIPPTLDYAIMLPVIFSGSRDNHKGICWTYTCKDGQPTLKPSVRHDLGDGNIIHYWLNDGVCRMLPDSTVEYDNEFIELSDFGE